MSYFDDASLVMIPSGYKTSKVYSVKPTDGSGDLDFTRAGDTATRVNSAGLIEKVRTNLILYSQDFGNANWLVGSLTKTTGQTDPNGGTTAVLATSTNTSGVYFYQTITGAGCMSVYAKAGTRSTFSIIPSVFGNGGFFNLSTVTASSLGTGSLAKIENVGGGWFRCSVAVSSSSNILFSLSDISGGGMTIGDTMTFAFAQFEKGDIATAYIPTTTAAVSVGPVANVPRLDYLGSTCPRLLLEPQRTNIQLNSEDFSQANWSKTNSAVVTNQLASPDGLVNADKLNETAVNSIHQLESTRSVSASTAYTMSVFAKKAERSFVRIYEDTTSNSAYFNLDSGTVGTVGGPTATAKIENYGNGWYRCSVTYTETGTSGRYRILIAKQDNEPSYLGVAGSGIYIWGAQYEAGAYATSYIPTLAASATRGADACSKTGISSLIGQTEGTALLDFQFNGATESIILDISASGLSPQNRIILYQPSGQIVQFIVLDNSVSQVSIASSSYSIGQRLKVAIAYKANDFAFYINGVQIGTDNSGSVPATSRIDIGNRQDAAYPATISVNQTLLFKTRLTNAELAELTTL